MCKGKVVYHKNFIYYINIKTPAKAFTPPAKPGGVGYIHLFLFCPTNSFLNQLLLGYLLRHFKTLLVHLM